MKETIQSQEVDTGRLSQAAVPDLAVSKLPSGIAVALLTGGGDRPYAFGLATELISMGAGLDLIGSDELDSPAFHGKKGVNFLNLRGDQSPHSSLLRKVFRLSMYYAKLIRYAATAKPRLFHILWNNKFELFDRTFLMLYYKALKKKIVLTIHNVNARKRDSKDTALNRLTLRLQYRLADHIFVHTEQMRRELIEDFGAQSARISVIPFGINNAVPNTGLTEQEAKQRLGIGDDKKTILFFGNITPYKGLEYLLAAFQQVLARCDDYLLIVAGRPKNRALAMLAVPWATSSWSERWRKPVIPSATTAESRLSIAPRKAIAAAEGISSRTIWRETLGKCGAGNADGIPPNRVPIVSTGSLKK